MAEKLRWRKLKKAVTDRLFCLQNGGDFDIYVSAATGGEAKRLTFQGEDDLPAAWKPDGQAVVFEAHDFPVAIPVWKIASVLVAGNIFVFKLAESTPATSVQNVEIFEKAGVPKGVLNLILLRLCCRCECSLALSFAEEATHLRKTLRIFEENFEDFSPAQNYNSSKIKHHR